MTYVYGSEFPDAQPTIITDADGDITINKPSSEICLQLVAENPFKHTVFQGIDHGAIVRESLFWNQSQTWLEHKLISINL